MTGFEREGQNPEGSINFDVGPDPVKVMAVL
jgi:hypothetical protein